VSPVGYTASGFAVAVSPAVGQSMPPIVSAALPYPLSLWCVAGLPIYHINEHGWRHNCGFVRVVLGVARDEDGGAISIILAGFP
jgi:hypothetical protein